MPALFEVFYQPGKLFESLPERKAAWVLPLLADIAVLLAITIATIRMIGMETILRQRLESAHLTGDQMQAAMARANSPMQFYVSVAAAAIGAPVMLLIISGCLMGFSMMTSRTPRFGSMFAMVALAFFPYWLVTGLMTIALLLATPDRAALDIQNLLATNIGAFVDKNSMSRGLYSLATSLDVLSFTEIGLLSFGFSKLTRVSVFFGAAAVVGLWVVYVSIKMAMSLLF